jgi:membrane protease YdiL (CAAX protease family)
MSRYWSHSKSAYYGVLCALPLLVVYELLLWSAGAPTGMQVRNAADVWLRLLLESLGLRPVYATLVMIGLLIATIPRLRKGDVRLEGRYLLLMLGEVLVYSLAFGIVINLLLYLLLYTWLASLHPGVPGIETAVAALTQAGSVGRRLLPAAIPADADLLTGIALSLGAGLFEEFAFRVVLLTVLLGFFRLFFRPGWAALLAILLASLAFSLAHYVGELGEPFSLHTLLYRWLAGLLFTLLYYQRGFAITAWSHALYDVWVLVI